MEASDSRDLLRNVYNTAPGEVVLQYVPEDRPPTEAPRGGLEFTVRRLERDKHYTLTDEEIGKDTVRFHAITPYRACVYEGRTVEEAVASLLRGVGELARSGAMNPARPQSPGAQPIQHAIDVLMERMQWQVDRRREHQAFVDDGIPSNLVTTDGGSTWAHKTESTSPEEKRAAWESAAHQVSRDNEIIAALGTAIAALARVKDL